MKTRVKNLARGGKAVRMYVKKVLEQEGLEGWRRAQERWGIDGWAGEAMGEMRVREGGRGKGLLGKRIGDVNGLECCQWRVRFAAREVLTASGDVTFPRGYRQWCPGRARREIVGRTQDGAEGIRAYEIV